MSPPRAVLWDNDGVLVDTEHLFFAATRELLEEHGIEVSAELYVDYSLRRGLSLLDLLLEQGFEAAEIPRLRDRRNARYSELLREGVRVLDGVRETLAALHGRVPMAVVTSSGRDHFELIHEPLGLLRFFDFVLAAGDYVRHKPDPDPYLTAARRLGFPPEDCVAIEDSERGLQAAHAAGMRCVVVPSGFTVGGDFVRAHRVLRGAHEIPALLFG